MLKRLAFVFLFLLTASSLRANTYTAASCGSSDFQTAVNSATDGDTVNGPNGGGSATWSGPVTVSKGITLNFNGCVINPNSSHLNLNTDSVGSLIVTNGTFSKCYGNGDSPFQVNLASGPPYNKIFRIYNVTFSGTNGGGTCVTTNGLGPGLIDHNEINGTGNADETFHILGGNAGCSSCWTEDVIPGGSDMVFMENNNWNYSGQYCQGEEANYGAVFVFRYNQLKNCQNDVHGAGPSTRWTEMYNNTYLTNPGTGSFMDFRGGSGVYFNNTYQTGVGITVGPIGSDTTGTYPVRYQFGMGLNGTNYTPVYFWNNSGLTSISSISNNNSSMVQIGTAPNDSAHCSGLSGSLCNAIYTSTQPVTLERCESAADVSAGCPVSYTYTPYTYPHPSDNCPSTTFGVVSGGCSSSSTSPVPPSGLTATVQ